MDHNKKQQMYEGSRQLGKFIMQLRKLERKPHHFGEVGPLTPSEIHMVEAIGMDDAILMNELASKLEITKGAVTQLVRRIEDKGLVRRSPDPNDARAIFLILTEKGKEAYRAHENVQVQFYEQLYKQLTAQEVDVFKTCMKKLNQFLGTMKG